jgi:hypothetical protein
MKIEQSAVAMAASHNFSHESEVSFESTSSFRTIYDGLSQTQGVAANDARDQAAPVLLLEALIARLLEAIAGQVNSPPADLRELFKADAAALPSGGSGRSQRVTEIEWTSEFTETIREHESTDFSATAKIRTADGRTLDARVDLAMCRDFTCQTTTRDGGKVVLRDPLLINFDGNAAELSGQRFEFDLDADGKSESIDALGRGSGFLAIDSNADGRIDDGSELFGALSGDGFADLAKLDGDGNRWLDDADAAFASLRVWRHDAAGTDRLTSLRDEGVGALYVGSAQTPFALTDSDNRTLAQIRASGIYLREDGSAGSLQQIDLAV